MQGICGFCHLDGHPASPTTLATMATTLVRGMHSTGHRRHEGPAAVAGMHWWRDHPGPTPVLLQHHAASGCSVVADARLAERATLRSALGLASPHPDGDSDAGLILQAWLRWQDRCVQHLEGDFAFAIHDPRRGGVFLARDGMGVRPLYFHHAPGEFLAFGSSVDAVLAHPQVPRTLDDGRIADFLVSQLEGIDNTSTFYRHIQRLPPASTLWVDARGDHRQRYWALQPARRAEAPSTDDEWAEAFAARLERAVARHLEGAPGQVGCMVSGGLDSSSLAVIASQQLGALGHGPLPTFSAINSPLAGCPETRAVQAVLALGGFRPSIADLADLSPMAGTLQECVLASEEPFDSSMTLVHAQYLMASRAGVPAVMDGIDGDSVFLAGNTLVRDIRGGRWRQALRNARAEYRMYSDGPSTLRQLARATVLAAAPGPALQAWRRLRTRDESRRNIASSLISRDLADRVDLEARLSVLRAQRPAVPPPDATGEALAALQHPYLTTALERYHRVAAAHGIQPRHPFTDRELLEFAVTLPDRQRQADGWSKPVLRRAMRGRLPEPVRLRHDKTSLGWRFNLAVPLNDPARIRDWVLAERGRLAPYIDIPRLEAALARPMPEAAEALNEAQSLLAWLTRPGARTAGKAMM